MAISVGRRQFISAFGGAAVALPFAARAQQPTMPVIGIPGTASANLGRDYFDAFKPGLK
jgi:hypothetical protein